MPVLALALATTAVGVSLYIHFVARQGEKGEKRREWRRSL